MHACMAVWLFLYAHQICKHYIYKVERREIGELSHGLEPCKTLISEFITQLNWQQKQNVMI